MESSLFIVAKERGRLVPTRINKQLPEQIKREMESQINNQNHIFSLIHKIVSSEK